MSSEIATPGQGLIPYQPINEKQAAYIIRSRVAWLNVLEGGKRAGKNIVNLIAWAACLETHPDKLHLAAGFTQSSARMNIIDSNGFGLKWIFAGRCWEQQYEGRDALFISTRAGVKIVLVTGGGKRGDEARIKGFSLGSVYLTEANEMTPDFVRECFDRTIASSDRKVFHDLNPEPPRHWYYTDILEHHERMQKADPSYGYNYEHLTIVDNMSLTDDHIRNMIATYDAGSQWFRRDILGQRTVAEGAIYENYRAGDVSITREEIRDLFFVDFSVGVDVGGTDATCATLNGFTHNYDMVVAIDGYYHKQGINHGKDHATYAREIAEWLYNWTLVYPRLARCNVFCESADKLFREALSKALKDVRLYGMKVVPSYKKDGIVDRIRTMQILINQGRKRIASHMTQWHQAYSNAVWDVDEYEAKQWVRVDDGSYPVDCLDSDEYSIQPFKPRLIQGLGTR